MDSVQEEILKNGFCPSTSIFHSQWDSSTSLHHSSSSFPHHLLHYSSATAAPPSKPAFIDAISGATLTFQDLRTLTASIAETLLVSGIRKGDVVLLVSPNSLHFPALVLGIVASGAIFTTANVLLTRQELETQVLDSNAGLIITTHDLQPKLDGLVARPLLLVHTLFANLATSSGGGSRKLLPDVNVSPDDVAALMYSSGTTGKSKAVVCTHGNLIAISDVLRHVWLRSGEVYLCVVPLCHMFGLSVFVCGAVAAGLTTVVLARRYTMAGMLAAVERHKVTRVMAVPPMVVEMGRRRRRKYELGSLKEVVCSGAPLAMEHMDRFANCYPNIRLSQCYGLTEAVGPVTVCDGVRGRVHPSTGRLLPSFTAKIIDVDTKKSLPPYAHGELCVKGPSVTKGYLNNQEATSLAIDEDGWLHTGDLCFFDLRGLVYVVDRIKELIKYKAYQVAPAELEEILSSHPDVIDVAVLPYPHLEVGEIPMACAVRRVGSTIKENDIISFMENKVAPYKKIRKVVFVDFIPRSPTGKILRRHLKEKITPCCEPEIPSRL